MNKSAFLFIIFVFLIGQIKCTSVAEKQALEDLYNFCNGDAWFNNTNWLKGDPCEENWYGVQCTTENSYGHIATLVLPNNGLSCKQIPDSFGNLFECQVIVLRGNEIGGEIPEMINKLSFLQSLDLSHNILVGNIPNELGELLDYNLIYLDLSYNYLSGAIPSFFNGAENRFENVDISNNDFVCPIPSWATYTNATCIQWEFIAYEQKCIISGQSVTIFGRNFAQTSGIECVLTNFTDGTTLSSSLATIVSDSIMICEVNYEFSPFCNQTSPQNTWYYLKFNLNITLQNTLLNPTQPFPISVINPYCETASFQVDDQLFKGNTTLQLLSSCNEDSSPLWQCPTTIQTTSAPQNMPAVYYPGCENNDEYICYGAEPYYSSIDSVCGYYYCYSNGQVKYYQTGCPAKNNYIIGNCYYSVQDCIENTSCYIF
eukprot:TRINITY_DN13860_c0_g1_i1.p1 TRINITY_DN13860_c0_g1~~TRINITY_DN13860_c0_g1_i1.p1  ORF type:complete len:442 (-),score=83.05 TRINITY_DN13860_c0_g1_i1:62-1348(-)